MSNEQLLVIDLSSTLARLSAVLGPPDGEPEALDGGITNRNFRVSFGGAPHVIRVPGKDTDLLGIDRRAEWAAACAAARAGVGPPVRAMLDDPPVLVTLFVEGHPVTSADLAGPELLPAVARALRTMHDSGEQLPSRFSAFEVVQAYAEKATERGAALPHGYPAALKRARHVQKAMRGPAHDPVPCHNDLLAANLIVDGARLSIVDWEYAGMGDRYFDLGNLAVNNELDDDAQSRLLEAYLGEPPNASQLASLQLMRFMSDFREAMWGVLQSAVSELDFDFHDYATTHFERLERTGEHPDFSRWIKKARGARA